MGQNFPDRVRQWVFAHRASFRVRLQVPLVVLFQIQHLRSCALSFDTVLLFERAVQQEELTDTVHKQAITLRLRPTPNLSRRISVILRIVNLK